ncbi:type II toxin-antitoxin system CcdA family antitoxin [Microbispora sp. NPDC088329]|uniref:type II toxin-antitoxin system CcdA family antitoxin n=1 Tax=Microbispora sp. NPDC088329 TaxID=3154869 RepID=UPI00341AB396
MNISVPEELAEQVRAYDLPISGICQDALGEAVRRARLEEKVMDGIEAVAERLQATLPEIVRKKYEQGYDVGVRWAKKEASVYQLKLAAGEVPNAHWQSDETIVELTCDPYIGEDPDGYELERAYERGVLEGASEVWSAARPLLKWNV